MRHLLYMSAFMTVSMLVQTLYLCSPTSTSSAGWGREAIAAVGLARKSDHDRDGVHADACVGTTALLAQAAWRKDQLSAERAF